MAQTKIPKIQLDSTIYAQGQNTVAVTDGGTGATTAATARTNLSAAASGANTDITSITGSAATLTTARTIQTNLASTTSTSFNGSANITPGVTGTLPVANGGTGTTTSTGTGSTVLSTSPTLTTPIIASITNTGTLTLPTVTGTISAYNQVTTTSSATPAPTGDSKENELYLTAQTVNMTFANPSGTPVNGNKLFARVTTAASQTIAYGTAYQSSGVATLLATTVAGKTHEMQFRYNSTAAKWILQAVDATGY